MIIPPIKKPEKYDAPKCLMVIIAIFAGMYGALWAIGSFIQWITKP